MRTQTAVRSALLDPELATPEGVVNPDGDRATKRFDVYRNNVAVSLTEALQAAFPVIRKLVGEAFFQAMAGVYLRQHPPSSPLMMLYGTEMPAFLESFGPAQPLPYLPDMARLELAIRQAYHAADAAPLDPAVLAALPEEALPHLRFAFAPTVHLVVSDHPVHGIWAANMESGGTPERRPETALVTRPDFDPVVDALTPAQGRVLAGLLAGQPLSTALRAGGSDFDFGPLLTCLLHRKAITALTTEESPS